MSASEQTSQPAYLDKLEQIINDVIAPAAIEIDTSGVFPRTALDALAGLDQQLRSGRLGSSTSSGGASSRTRRGRVRFDGDGRVHALLRHGGHRGLWPALGS